MVRKLEETKRGELGTAMNLTCVMALNSPSKPKDNLTLLSTCG